ncbi:3,4-dihydroxy 2-butanone 4-phosphate synthase/GTP cyclohydrolase II [Nocardia transvalensis]|uniref:3,4-dihydroxy-2-butanone-4-phosphate synthase n=1 Tax=Nocardia transvalensis TaxID=37333 RepID=A0A7W9UJN2_9NOCA|nr:3,4-dihydroxy-2-butanone-4-phosphate synthase [Nocardia transvalensis]MBB5915467.1 3,4-dihydroxy 2-butanone 4-phosphate synthase/GTP cyclohydrolase II [Nocardia transvalensis]
MSAPYPRDRIAAATAALCDGGIVLVVAETGDGYRGDLVAAAERIGADTVNAMTTIGCGPTYVAMPSVALDGLEIPPADPTATGPARARFRVSVGLAGDEGPGIRASHRAKTVRALADPSSTPRDFTRPGQIFPLGCAAGGVLAVPAPPEAAVDLVELAGLWPAGVLCEVCGADGELARLAELLELGRRHGIPVVLIEDLVGHRKRELCRVRECGTARIPLPMGEFRAFGFTDGFGRDHIAFVHGEPATSAAPLVRVHIECLFGDALGSARCGCGAKLRCALERIARAGDGVLVYVRSRESGVRMLARVLPAGWQTSAGTAHPVEHGDLHSAFDIVEHLGLREIRLLCDGAEEPFVPDQVRIVERVPLSAGIGSPARDAAGIGSAS